jgi:hypothetical protein
MGRKRRLSVMESANLDGRHRVYLLRRDDVEHLVLVGPNTSQVIEIGNPAPPSETGTEPAPPGFGVFKNFLPKDKA